MRQNSLSHRRHISNDGRTGSERSILIMARKDLSSLPTQQVKEYIQMEEEGERLYLINNQSENLINSLKNIYQEYPDYYKEIMTYHF